VHENASGGRTNSSPSGHVQLLIHRCTPNFFNHQRQGALHPTSTKLHRNKQCLPAMAPLLTKKMYGERQLFNPAPSFLHIKDLVQAEEAYLRRTSDLITGMLLLGCKIGATTKVEASYSQVGTLCCRCKAEIVLLQTRRPTIH
jgi:hypothetical protein